MLPENMDTTHIFAYVCKGIEGKPADQYGIHVTKDEADQPRPLATWDGHSYWVVDLINIHALQVVMHIYYEGQRPPDDTRDGINNQVKGLTNRILFGDENG